MANTHTFTSVRAFCAHLQISKSTFYRRAKECGICLNGRLLSPEKQEEIKAAIISPPPEKLPGAPG